jgi:hypothetical protein
LSEIAAASLILRDTGAVEVEPLVVGADVLGAFTTRP